MVETDYVSDGVDIDEDALMDEPMCTIEIDLSQLTAQQVLGLVNQFGAHRLSDDDRWKVGEAMAGKDVEFEDPMELHLDGGRAMTLLRQAGFIEMPHEVEQVEGGDGDGN